MAGTASFRVIANSGRTVHPFADRALSRMAGAPLIPGNSIRLLRNGDENYPNWIEAIRAAKRVIHFETYVFRNDPIGRQFAELLEMKARQGVTVRLIYDWFGVMGAASFLFWRRLRKAGVEVRCFNRLRLDDPIESLRRDHRKIIVVDGCIGFVSGLCVGQPWAPNGDGQNGSWRDTGVRIEGPAVVELDRSFRRMWDSLDGDHLTDEPALENAIVPPAGDVALRIVSGEPGRGGLYRLDLLTTALARRSIWLTDAYFFATPTYVQALCAAVRDGVDVRLLVPQTSDIPVVRALSRVGYRTLLEAGVRIFEWNGSMLHAKTAVVDDGWSRVGSTNLNLASWMSNYELDVVVEDREFGRAMKKMYLEDLANSTEIVLTEGTRVRAREERRGVRRGGRRGSGSARASAGRAAKGVIAIGSTAGAAIARPRLLGPAEAPITAAAALVLLAVCVMAAFLPHIVSILTAICCGWLGLTLLLKSLRMRSAGKKQTESPKKAKHLII